MSNSLAEPLYERLLRSFPPNQSHTQADWEGDAMPAPMRHYLNHLLRHHGQREARRLRRARTDWVDYDHPQMEQAVRTFFATLDDHTQVPADEWTDTLRTATRRVTTYLVRPVPFLKSFVFDEHTGSIAVSQIRWRMQFFDPYEYLREAVQAFAEKRSQDALEAETFERTLYRVDRRMTADFGTDRWLRLLDPLFDTARRATGRRQVPIPLLHTFFDEKKASRIVERLKAHEQRSDAEAVDPETLRRLIEAAAQEPSTEDRDPTTPRSAERFLESTPESSSDDALQDEADSPPSPDPTVPTDDERTGDATPLWKRFQQGRPQQGRPQQGRPQQGRSRRNTETDEDQAEDSQPLWTQFKQSQTASSSGEAQETPSPDQSASRTEPQAVEHEGDLSSLERNVLGTGNPSHRDTYIEKLFQGDEAAYRRVLERLRATESWSEASQIIASDVFQAYQVNIYSDAAVHFTNAVEAAFKK